MINWLKQYMPVSRKYHIAAQKSHDAFQRKCVEECEHNLRKTNDRINKIVEECSHVQFIADFNTDIFILVRCDPKIFNKERDVDELQLLAWRLGKQVTDYIMKEVGK